MQLILNGKGEVCNRGTNKVCNPINIVFPPTTLTLFPNFPQNVAHKEAIPAIPETDYATLNLQAYVILLGGTVLNSATASVTQN